MSFCADCGNLKTRCKCSGATGKRRHEDKKDAQPPSGSHQPPSSPELIEATNPQGPFDLGAFAKALQPFLKDSVKESVKEAVKETMEDLEGKMTAVQTKVEDHEERIKAIEAKQRGEPNQRGGAWDGFSPNYLEIKGFCPYDKRKEQGATRAQAKRIVDMLTDKLPEDIRPAVGDLMLRGMSNYTIRVKVEGAKAQEIRGCWNDILKADNITINDVVPYVIAERSPAVQQKFNKLGQLLESARRAAAQVEDNITITAEWTTMTVYAEEAGDERPMWVADLNPQGDQVVNARHVMKLFKLDEEAFLALGRRD